MMVKEGKNHKKMLALYGISKNIDKNKRKTKVSELGGGFFVDDKSCIGMHLQEG